MSQREGTVEDLNTGQVLREIWAGKWLIGFGLLVGLGCAFFVMESATPHYQARMMIAPAQQIEIGGAVGSGGFGDGRGGYSAGGQGLSRGAALNFTNFEAIYAGPSVARLLLRDRRVLNGLEADRSFSFLETGAEINWSAARLAEYLRKRVWLDPFGESEFRALNYRHPDPVFAAYFVRQIHRTADQLIRSELRGGVDQRISYLERAIAKTLNPEHRRAITGLLLEQERVRMIVSMDEPVAAKVIEKATSLPRAVWPDRGLFFAGFGLLGMFVGYLVFGLRRGEDVVDEDVVGADEDEVRLRLQPILEDISDAAE